MKAKINSTEFGKAPDGEGWFVLNAAEAEWVKSPDFGHFCRFESETTTFPHVGINIHVMQPGQPGCHYHRENQQENFLVLSGQCKLLIEDQEVELGPMDFVHCPPDTDHVLIGAGKEPCTVVAIGCRKGGVELTYPKNELAAKYNASSPETTNDPRVSYAKCKPREKVKAPS